MVSLKELRYWMYLLCVISALLCVSAFKLRTKAINRRDTEDPQRYAELTVYCPAGFFGMSNLASSNGVLPVISVNFVTFVNGGRK